MRRSFRRLRVPHAEVGPSELIRDENYASTICSGCARSRRDERTRPGNGLASHRGDVRPAGERAEFLEPPER